jgi:hypothetical protein
MAALILREHAPRDDDDAFTNGDNSLCHASTPAMVVGVIAR